MDLIVNPALEQVYGARERPSEHKSFGLSKCRFINLINHKSYAAGMMQFEFVFCAFNKSNHICFANKMLVSTLSYLLHLNILIALSQYVNIFWVSVQHNVFKYWGNPRRRVSDIYAWTLLNELMQPGRCLFSIYTIVAGYRPDTRWQTSTQELLIDLKAPTLFRKDTNQDKAVSMSPILIWQNIQ